MGHMARFKREVRNCIGKPLAYEMREGFGASLSVVLERIARGHRVYDGEIKEFFGRQGEEGDGPEVKHIAVVAGPQLMPSQKPGKYTAVVPMQGVALYDFECQPYCFSTKLLADTMNQLASDPSVESIVLIVDTPGGSVTGTAEAGDAVFAARKKKTVTAIVDPLCASAGYWIASQATSIIAVPSADIGSVGVFMMHADCSAMLADAGIKPTFIYAGEYKVEGNSYEPLSAEAKAYYQSEVDVIYSDFISAIARGRGVKAADVLENFGKGRCLSSINAKAVGMIDDIQPMRSALAACGIQMAPPSDDVRRRVEDGAPDPAAEASPAVVGHDEPAAEPTAAQVVSDEDCAQILFRQDRAEDGSVSVYALGDWPAKAKMNPAAFQDSKVVAVVGDTVTITVENGAAVYTKAGVGESGAWICALSPGSFYSKAPPSVEEARETERSRLAAARRRRLSLEALI